MPTPPETGSATRQPRHTHAAPASSPTELRKPAWVAVLKRAVREFRHDQVSDRAAALTYFGVLAIFPAILVLVSILGLIGQHNAQRVLDNLDNITPGGVHSFLRTIIEQVQGKQGAAGIAAVAGIVIALWSASGYVAAFMRAANVIYGAPEGRPIWWKAPVRVGTTLALAVMLIVAVVIVVVTGPIARQVGGAIGMGDVAVTVWDIAKWPVLIILVSIMLSLLYWATPNIKQPGFRWITPGGVLAVLIWLVVSGLFAVYVSFSGSYNRTYGSLATVIVFLVWLWLTNIAILLGLEFNAELERQRLVQAGLPEDVDPYLPLRAKHKLDDLETRRAEEAERMRQAHLPEDRDGR
jgi:membrane protein